MYKIQVQVQEIPRPQITKGGESRPGKSVCLRNMQLAAGHWSWMKPTWCYTHCNFTPVKKQIIFCCSIPQCVFTVWLALNTAGKLVVQLHKRVLNGMNGLSVSRAKTTGAKESFLRHYNLNSIFSASVTVSASNCYCYFSIAMISWDKARRLNY